MTTTEAALIQEMLKEILEICAEIQKILETDLEKTEDMSYRVAIELDIITLNNLKNIIDTVQEDIKREIFGSSIELLLRIAANDFKKRLLMIPVKRARLQNVLALLDDAHKRVFEIKMRMQQ